MLNRSRVETRNQRDHSEGPLRKRYGQETGSLADPMNTAVRLCSSGSSPWFYHVCHLSLRADLADFWDLAGGPFFSKNTPKFADLSGHCPITVIYECPKGFQFYVLLEVSHQTMATKAAGKKRMTQSEVFNHFADKTGMKRAQVKEFFDELYNLASGQVKSNGEFVLPGFGKLVKSERKAREGRNPATGETIQIPAKTTLKFRVGKAMKDTVLPRK